jgi:hypothetical protein
MRAASDFSSRPRRLVPWVPPECVAECAASRRRSQPFRRRAPGPPQAARMPVAHRSRWRSHRPFRMVGVVVRCCRSGHTVAVAHAFALLGLISHEAADAAITHARRALKPGGVGGSEPEIWPSPARDYRAMRGQGPQALAWIPRAVAVGASQLPVAATELRCDWFRAAQAGIRFQIQAVAVAQQPPLPRAGMDLGELSATDDVGRSYRLRWDGVRGSSRLWVGEVVAEPMSFPERHGDIAWFELATVNGPARRVVFAPSPTVSVGPAAPPWPTPAESYLAWLSRQDRSAQCPRTARCCRRSWAGASAHRTPTCRVPGRIQSVSAPRPICRSRCAPPCRSSTPPR